MNTTTIEFPGTPLEPNSIFYIKRPSMEKLIFQEITHPGCIIRIKAPQLMGKTSLVLRLIAHAKSLEYHTVYLDLQKADKAIFASINKFLRWLCANVSQQLQLPVNLDNYWDDDIGSKISCSIYFQHYLLRKINNPLVLVFNELNRILEYPEIAEDFLPLIRAWHEEAKQEEILQKLRFVLVHSTEIYITLNINKSPFNVGLTVKIPEFTVEDIQELAQRHGLDWTEKAAKRNAFALKSMLGGHPYLVRLTLYHLANNANKTLDQILEDAPTITSIYSSHLKNLLITLQENIELKAALQELIAARGKLNIDHILAYKLESLGLIKLEGDSCTFSCELYRQYFSNQPWEKLNQWQYLKQLQQEKKTLEELSNTDNLTQLANQRYFDTLLNDLWPTLAEEEAPISLIILDADHLKIYNKTYGREAGDNCLRKIADLLKEIANSFSIRGSYQLTATRYDSGEFALLVPGKASAITFKLAEYIREQVINLAIPLDSMLFSGLTASFVTISLGVSSIVPSNTQSPAILVQDARQALEKSKKNERNRTTMGSMVT
ncbi:MAG: AAA-like domain-containing protein [Scytonematopsis contorta HA4267-MV1]|jgi:diguanylate cyclase (GGDEF)-like protein|nr:AAA-like domain-containing protein [Scytonematopsis contorta HA4267-MV1]